MKLILPCILLYVLFGDMLQADAKSKNALLLDEMVRMVKSEVHAEYKTVNITPSKIKFGQWKQKNYNVYRVWVNFKDVEAGNVTELRCTKKFEGSSGSLRLKPVSDLFCVHIKPK